MGGAESVASVLSVPGPSHLGCQEDHPVSRHDVFHCDCVITNDSDGNLTEIHYLINAFGIGFRCRRASRLSGRKIIDRVFQRLTVYGDDTRIR